MKVREKTFTTYAATEAITWRIVGGIARPIKVQQDYAAPLVRDYGPCKRCKTGRRRASNARYCQTCRQIVDTQQRCKRMDALKHPCADCSELVGQRATRCRSCAQRRRHETHKTMSQAA